VFYDATGLRERILGQDLQGADKAGIWSEASTSHGGPVFTGEQFFVGTKRQPSMAPPSQ
jgi:hypothetical protein